MTDSLRYKHIYLLMFFSGDEIFPLTQTLMKPYARTDIMSITEKVYNYRWMWLIFSLIWFWTTILVYTKKTWQGFYLMLTWPVSNILQLFTSSHSAKTEISFLCAKIDSACCSPIWAHLTVVIIINHNFFKSVLKCSIFGWRLSCIFQKNSFLSRP